jgi:hypothetical protein
MGHQGRQDRLEVHLAGTNILQALLPLFSTLLTENQLLSKHITLPTFTILDGPAAETKPSPEQPSHNSSYKLLAAATASAGAALAIYTTSPTFALGTSSVIFAATGLVLFESTVTATTADDEDNTRGLVSADGTLSRRVSMSGARKIHQLAALRDVAAAIAVICGIASYFMELSVTSTSITWEPVYRKYARDWRDVHNYRILLQVLWTIPATLLMNILIFIIVSALLLLHVISSTSCWHEFTITSCIS